MFLRTSSLLGLTYTALNIAVNKEPLKRYPFGLHRLEVFATFLTVSPLYLLQALLFVKLLSDLTIPLK
jgi:Co/Zn/Cd efflux system component